MAELEFQANVGLLKRKDVRNFLLDAKQDNSNGVSVSYQESCGWMSSHFQIRFVGSASDIKTLYERLEKLSS